ncbi:MAG: hypothetical protein JKY80_05185 [Mariprofundaceae bacterium]|nr:hypothetical protein [Mariprofundaceae bacterium]
MFFTAYVFMAFIERLQIAFTGELLPALLFLGLVVSVCLLSGVIVYLVNWKTVQNATVNQKGGLARKQTEQLGLFTIIMLGLVPLFSLLVISMFGDFIKVEMEPSHLFTSYSPVMILFSLGKPYFIHGYFILFEFIVLPGILYRYYHYLNKLGGILSMEIQTKKEGFMKSKLTSKQTSSAKKLLGQEKAEKAVQQAFESWMEENEDMPLSLVFSGPSGTGKT